MKKKAIYIIAIADVVILLSVVVLIVMLSTTKSKQNEVQEPSSPIIITEEEPTPIPSPVPSVEPTPELTPAPVSADFAEQFDAVIPGQALEVEDSATNNPYFDYAIACIVSSGNYTKVSIESIWHDQNFNCNALYALFDDKNLYLVWEDTDHTLYIREEDWEAYQELMNRER